MADEAKSGLGHSVRAAPRGPGATRPRGRGHRQARAASGLTPCSFPAPQELYLETYYLQCLAHASYIVAHGGNAFIVDPRRDVDMYIDELKARGLRLRGVLLTHIHADFVSGHYEILRRTNAAVMISRHAGAEFPHLATEDEDEFVLSNKHSIRSMHSPGHTPGCTTWLLVDRESGKPTKAFTGDTLFVGNVGRPDLLGSVGVSKETLASTMFDTLRSRIMQLPDDCGVFPAHGAGSPCGKGLSTELSSTIGKEKATNPALQYTDRDEFVKYITSGQPHAPQYFLGAVALNKAGAQSVSEVIEKVPPLNEVDFAEAMRSEEHGERPLVCDTREADEWCETHVPGSWSFPIGVSGGVVLREHDGNMGIWLGTLVRPNQPMLVIAPPGKERETLERFSRIGYHSVVGYLVGGIESWASAGFDTASLDRLDLKAKPEEARAALSSDEYQVVDVRTPGEYGCPVNGHVKGAINVDLNTLPAGADGLDKSKKYVCYCSGGYRSNIALSIFLSRGLDFRDVRGGYHAIQETSKDLTTAQ